ncbi:PREDICTED: nose resistant to fluoxetine protein 6-like [Polistes dominula]|uniref:Nose resistant to fluoxetine protein 6-like n=1 Tax=Polistes dominula TaxID=743375 RepID=A0ABM1J7Z0_POLDO|nr:PREDICTED: nose resistant to fluoxetine protein 6-like [Polistes dominula]
MIIGTAYDVLIYQKHLKKDEKYLQKPTNDNSLTIEDPKALDNSNKNHMKKLKYHRFFSKIFIAFSVYSNTKIIFSTKSEDSDILAIHGIRFLTMIWIILVHMCLYLEYFYDNKQILVRNLDGFFTQVIINGTTGVDTFFCFGSFLVAYLYFKKYTIKNIHEPNNYLNVIKLYFIALLKRFIRLTPPYMIIIGLLQIITTWYSKTSLFPIMERNHENCQSYWWRNFLYIQNLFSLQNMCMSWSWYLANDMQYFVIINFLLYLSSTYFKIAASLLGLLFTSSIILTGYISYIYNYVPTVDKIINLMDVIYYPPWIRIGPSLVGVITAFIVIKLNNKLLWKKKTIIFFSILASLCNLLVLFGLYERRISVLNAAIYVALSRTVWAIGIAWLLIACCTNNGGIVNSILSWKVWIPFSRLTYAAYLINPIVISSVNFLNDTSLHFNIPLLGILGLGNVVLIYICSYIVSLMFELPYINLMKEGMKYLN